MRNPSSIAQLIQEDIRFNNGLISEDVPLPKVHQAEDYDCGAAALRSICQYFGVGPKDESEFIDICNSGERKGTRPEEIVQAASKFGLKAEMFENMSLERLCQFLDHEIPVICAIQAWGDEDDYEKNQSGHYVVAVSHDDEKIYFEDPSMDSSSRGFLPKDEFVSRWHDIQFGESDPEHHLAIAVWSAAPVKPVEKQSPENAPKIVQ